MNPPRIPGPQGPDLGRHVRAYWNARIHDLEMTDYPVGTLEFFDDLDNYRFDKLSYLPRTIDFRRLRRQAPARGRAAASAPISPDSPAAVPASSASICRRRRLAWREEPGAARPAGQRVRRRRRHAAVRGQQRRRRLRPRRAAVLAPNPRRIIEESLRVLKPGGTAIYMVYNRVSWLHALSKLMKVELEHEDAPVLRLYSIPEFRDLIRGFSSTTLIPDDSRSSRGCTRDGRPSPTTACSSARSMSFRVRSCGASAGT